MSEKLYKFLNGNESEHGYHEWEIGKWYEVEGELKMCENGFHASGYIQDALFYVQGDTLAVVEVDGEHISGDDKQCWQKMRVVETHDWTPIQSLKLAIYSAKIANDGYDEYGCVETAVEILDKLESSEEIQYELIKSAWAAKSAAWAAESAEVVARAAAEAAGWAARAAALSAAESAESAEAVAWAAKSAGWAVSWAAALSAESALSAEAVARAAARAAEAARASTRFNPHRRWRWNR